MQSRRFLSIVLSLIMLTGVTASGIVFAQTDEVDIDDSVEIEGFDNDTIEEEHDDRDDDVNETKDEPEIEIEVEIEDGIAKIKIEIEDEELRFEIEWIDEQSTIEEIVLRTDLSLEQISNLISFEFEDDDELENDDNEQTKSDKLAEKLAKLSEKQIERADKLAEKLAKLSEKQIERADKLAEKLAKLSEKQIERVDKLAEKLTKIEDRQAEKLAKADEKLAKAQERLTDKLAELESKLTEKARLSEERANKIIDKIEKETQKINDRVQKLLDKHQSGKFFGNLKNPDVVIKSFTLSFEGIALEINNSSNVSTFNGEFFLDNLVTENISKKFRITGGELFIGETEVYDVVFGKARLSSSGQGGDKDSMIVIAQTYDGVDIRTLRLSIDLSEAFDSETESVDIEILSPQSKIAGLWFLSGIGSLTLTESEEPIETQDSEEPNVIEPEVPEIEDIPHTTILTVSTLQESYVLGDKIVISGTVGEIFENTPVILQTVTASDLIEIAQIDVTSSGEFTHSIQATGPQWQTSNTYTVKAFYGGNNFAQTTFEFLVE
ncbi:MAG: hypothetical protein IIB02_07560 [Thaumarchaeota archaeon]|nr:hypothetical protein [Nitrososphaerota archaeon]